MRTLFFALALAVSAPPARPALVVGSPAPPIAVERWIQGAPTSIAPGKIVVLEFWATWCGPCIEAMPHLSTLAEKYKGKIDVVGVDVMDRNVLPEEKQPNNPAHVERVKKWMTDNPGKMRYLVALDDAADTMNKTWLLAAGKNAIPATFVVKDKQIMWIGGPTEVEQPLAEIVAGTYDLKTAMAKYDLELSMVEKAADLKTFATKGDVAGLEKAFAEYKALDAKKAVDQITPLVHALTTANPALAAPFLEKRVADTYDDPTYLLMITYAVSFKAEKSMDAYKALVDFSSKHVGRVPPTSAAISYAYYALMQLKLGNTDVAREWINKAEAAVDQHEPLRTRENIRGFVKDAKSKIK